MDMIHVTAECQRTLQPGGDLIDAGRIEVARPLLRPRPGTRATVA